MQYLNFINDENVLSSIVGSTIEEINELESELGFKLPLALNEYLLLMGEKTDFYEYVHEHGTKKIIEIRKVISHHTGWSSGPILAQTSLG